MAKKNKYKDKNDEITFNLVDESTIKRLQRNGEVTLPRKKVDVPKDEQWNTKTLNSKLLQTILNGDSLDKFEKDLISVIGNNAASLQRNARTMVTGAECGGRVDSYKELEEMGVIQKKVWLSCADDRTRESHLDIDGEEVDINETFSNGLMYPADPSGEPSEVWNCRCTIRDHIIGFKRKDGSISYVKDDDVKTRHDKEVEEERERRENIENKTDKKEAENKVVYGKDITKTWTRREDEFDFEIDDVINAQGFDGLPKVVSEEEFDRYVEDSSFIAQRTYSAPDQETLDAYREQLYNGDWYVDCSTGGSQYGQGMYCAADYNGELTDGIKSEMEHYQELGTERMSKDAWYSFLNDLSKDDMNDYIDLRRVKELTEDEFRVFKELKSDDNLTGPMLPEEDKKIWQEMCDNGKFMSLTSSLDNMKNEFYDNYKGNYYTETFTLDPSARIIKYKDLVDMYESSHDGEGIVTEAQMRRQLSRVLDGDALDDAIKNAMESQIFDDYGSYAAALGYDAINAEGHGESGSYTIILNRTKVIFKGE